MRLRDLRLWKETVFTSASPLALGSSLVKQSLGLVGTQRCHELSVCEQSSHGYA